jgi:hypothetical protein
MDQTNFQVTDGVEKDIDEGLQKAKEWHFFVT